MTHITTVTRSLRATRLCAQLPRATALVVALVLIAAGLRTTLAGPAKSVTVRRSAAAAPIDQGAEGFAEAFARAYFTWSADDPAAHAQGLRLFMSGLDEDAGVRPVAGSSQEVLWTAVAGDTRERDVQLITVVVQTKARLLYLSVPVSRDGRGALYIPSYPAIVGPPATDPSPAPPHEDAVEDTSLLTVVDRAIRNYLGGNAANLRADLTPGAVVSLPAERLTVTRVTSVTWVTRGRRAAVELEATDAQRDSFTLRYELDVAKRERWYVRSVHIDPTKEK